MNLLTSFFETVKLWDQTGLFHVNQVWSNPFFDAVMPWLREPALWMPLYLFFIVFVAINFGRNGIFWILFFILTVVFCDQLSNFFKHWIQRPRPCKDPAMMNYIRLRLQSCSSSFSFTSSHAANHFGMAMFIHQTLKKLVAMRTGCLFLWAFSICYAQMYVGIHYPIDIIGGTLIGLLGGGLCAYINNCKFPLQLPINKEVVAVKI